MRANARNPLQKALDLATQQTLDKLRTSGLLGQNDGIASSPPQSITTAGETEDGVIYTIHSVLTEVDSTDDPAALTTA